MFIISLSYVAPLDQVDTHLAAHRAFLREHYDKGVLLMSGRKVPRDGGILIADAASRAEVEALVRRDPFHVAGVARYDITEFVPSMTSDALAALRRD
ncbi:YciI family protein [Massilia sp. R2A-15]|uniref:YciI family protein n=1 Tax=Massilia sp. R2A-15 TaxID=3064278 RepID=UPI002736C669|nr:YciI family protein [Massilia sp. R2A-15]WLI90390.1 YciI family protein [Massilia sp. R2A-15]